MARHPETVAPVDTPPQGSEAIQNGSPWLRGQPLRGPMALAAAVPPERPRADEPVGEADFLPLLLAARKVAPWHLDDAQAACEDLCGDLVIRLEARRFERQ